MIHYYIQNLLKLIERIETIEQRTFKEAYPELGEAISKMVYTQDLSKLRLIFNTLNRIVNKHAA